MRRALCLALAAQLLFASTAMACDAERLAWGAAREARVASLGERMLTDTLALRFGEARGRVAAFGDWAYGWVESYAISYRLLGEVVRGARDAWQERGAPPSAEELSARMSRPIQDAFRQRVTAPVFGGGALAADMDRLAAALGAEWPAAPGLAASLRASLPGDPSEELVSGADAQTIFLRSTRPMATRLGSMLLRLTEAGSLVGGAAALGWGSAGLAGGAVGSAAGIGLFWGFDWMVNRTDAALHRAGFEAQAMRALDASEERLLAQGRAAVAGAVAAAGEAFRAAGCPDPLDARFIQGSFVSPVLPP